MADTVLETLIVELRDNGPEFITGLEKTIARAKASLGDLKVDINFGNAEVSARRLKSALDPIDESIQSFERE